MQKLINKTDANTVGVDAHIDPIKQNKGITLIALIITIIVMLILVGVTINVALNGGLFEKAETAKTQTIKELEREELISIAVAAYDANTREVKKSDLNFNGKYTEETDKTTSEKIVVKGENGILWQIDVASANVEEYKQEEAIEFYGVAYRIETEEGGIKFYFLENNIAFQSLADGYAAIKYTRNGNEISFGSMTGVLSEYYQTLALNESLILTRNENDIYEYVPTYDNTNNLYLNAFYLDEQSDEMLFISEPGVSDFTGAVWSISELSEISTDGRQVTYKGNIYTLVEEI